MSKRTCYECENFSKAAFVDMTPATAKYTALWM